MVETWLTQAKVTQPGRDTLANYVREAREVRDIYLRLYADKFVLKTKEAVRAEYALPRSISKEFGVNAHDTYDDAERAFLFCCVGVVRERRGGAVLASCALKPRGKHGLQDRIQEYMSGIGIIPIPK